MSDTYDPERRIRMAEISLRSGRSPRTIYRLIREKNFPKGYRVSHKVSVWLEGDFREWLAKDLAGASNRG